MEYSKNGYNILKSDNRGAHQDSDNFEFTDILYKFLPFWPIVVVSMLLSVIIAYCYLQYTVPLYQVSSVILVKDDKKGTNEVNILESLDMFGSKKNVENEMEILRSRSLMEQVVNDLKLYAPVYYEGKLRDISAYVVSPVKIEVRHPEFLNETKRADFNIGKNNAVLFNNKVVPVNEWFVYNDDSLRFIPNPAYRKKKDHGPLFFSLVNTKRIVNDLANNINIVASNKQSTAIDLSLKDPVAVRGEDILNGLLRSYISAGIEDKNVLAANTLTFVENRLRYIVHELDSVESEVQHYKTRKGIVDISEQGKNFLQSVETNDEKVSQINMQLAVIDQVETYINSKEYNTGIVPSTLGINDPVLTQLLQRLYDLEIEYERLKKTTAINNPLLVSVQDQINKVKPGIFESLKNQRNSLVAGRNNLTKTSNGYSAVLSKIPQNERELLEITRQQVIKNNIYTFLLEKREETALSFASTVGDSRVVDSAKADVDPVSPKKQLVYLMAILLSLGGSLIFLYIKDALNPNVFSKTEIKKLIQWPVVGEISQSGSKQTLVVNSYRNVAAEQFRHLRTALGYFGIDKNHRKILVTSSIAGEGKTFIAANLAISLAITNKRVVLIELDLRSPKLHTIFTHQQNPGITNFLSKKGIYADDIISVTDHENLFFIDCGTIPPNPSELILSARLGELFLYLEKEFDYVIVNAAPVVPVTDAYTLSKFCDITLFIVRYNFTPKYILKRINEDNEIMCLKNVGVIFNGMKSTKLDKKGYGYIHDTVSKKKARSKIAIG